MSWTIQIAIQNAVEWVAFKLQKLISHSSGGWEAQDQGVPDSVCNERPVLCS